MVFLSFFDIGYKIQVDDETIGYTNNILKTQDIINTYLTNTECLNGGYIKMDKNIKYKFAIFFKCKLTSQDDILYYVHNNSKRYYKMFSIKYNDDEIFCLTSGDVENIYNELQDFDAQKNLLVDEYYNDFIIVNNSDEINEFINNYKNSFTNDYFYSFRRPTSRGTITSRYGSRWGRMHTGIDIADELNTQINAAQDGVVVSAGYAGAYGNLIQIEHKYGYITYYAHCNKILVKKGDLVKQGQLIANMGSTGRSTGVHVHFEIRLNGKILNPYDCIFER